MKGEITIVHNLDEMKALVARLSARLGQRALILLDGPMGAGKTQVTQFLVEALGGQGSASPSFAIHHSYETPRGPVEHFDLFRLKNEDDLESTGFWDFFRASQGVIVIEWFARLKEFGLEKQLPRTWPRIEITIVPGAGETERTVKIQKTGPLNW